jgi:signal transduction histidine kinase/CheY-like chemotaxis protein
MAVACGAYALGEAPLTSLADVLKLTNEQAASPHPFQLRAQVTLSEPDAYYLFFQDGPHGIYSRQPPRKMALKPGDWVEIEGVTARGGYAPVLDPNHIEVVGHSPLPAAVEPGDPSIPDSANLWAVARGRILRADARSRAGFQFLTFYMRSREDTQFGIVVAMAGQCRPPAFVDAEVEVHGIWGTLYGGAGNRTGGAMFVATCEALDILVPPRVDWSLPLKNLHSLITYNSGTRAGDMVRVHGKVTLAFSPERFYIQEGDKGIPVEPLEPGLTLHTGDSVEVLGRLIQDETGARRIASARVRPSSSVEPVEIRALSDIDKDTGYGDALVSVEGEILSREITPGRVLFGLGLANEIVIAELPLPAGASPDSVPDVKDRVAITGIARVRPALEDRNVEVRLAARSLHDIRIVKRRPIAERISWGRVALVATGIALGALMWILALRNRVRARTRQLDEARLDAERASRAKGEFLANMSHEIRTPMNGILGAAELVLQSDLTADQRELVQTAKSSTEGLLTIINDILDFSKIEAGKLALDATPFALRTMIEDLLKAHHIAASKKGLRLRTNIAGDVPARIVADPTRLAQVIANLVGNAIKFTSEGEVELRIALDDLSRDGARLHFSVRDTGIGIPESKQQAIFEAFAQADASTSRRYGGTGLGLSISSALVTLLGGRLWVESEIDKGSCFHFVFTAPVPAEQYTPGDLPSSSGAPETGLRILLAEDNVVNQKLAVRLLEKQGHSVIPASNGHEAIALFDRHPFDLILMDVQMPGMDGFETTAAIREKEKFRGSHILIVALTAHAMSGDRERCLAAGMDGYASKPIRAEDLMTEIHRLRTTTV